MFKIHLTSYSLNFHRGRQASRPMHRLVTAVVSGQRSRLFVAGAVMRLEMLGEVIGPREALIAHSARVRPDAAVRPPVARQLVGPRERPRTARPRARERFLSGVAAHVRLEVRALAVHSTTQYRSLCCRSRTSHHNMTLPALLNCGTGGRYRSIAGTRRPQGSLSRQQTSRTPLLLLIDGTNRRTDRQTPNTPQPLHRPCSAYYSGSVNDTILITRARSIGGPNLRR